MNSEHPLDQPKPKRPRSKLDEALDRRGLNALSATSRRDESVPRLKKIRRLISRNLDQGGRRSLGVVTLGMEEWTNE